MSVEQEYCLDPETQSECYSTKPQPLSNGQAVFFVVLPKFMNVDIRIVIGKKEFNVKFMVELLNKIYFWQLPSLSIRSVLSPLILKTGLVTIEGQHNSILYQ